MLSFVRLLTMLFFHNNNCLQISSSHFGNLIAFSCRKVTILFHGASSHSNIRNPILEDIGSILESLKEIGLTRCKKNPRNSLHLEWTDSIYLRHFTI